MVKAFLVLLALSAFEPCLAQRSPPAPPKDRTALSFSEEDLSRLVEDRGAGHAASDGSISIVRLSHKPSRRAESAFMRGMKAAKAGAHREAAEEFEKTVSIDPDLSEAYGNLGVEYSSLGRLDDAVRAFHMAVGLDPATTDHHANLAFTLLQLKRYEEAQTEAQTAMDLAPTNSKAQFLVGYLLARQPETRDLAKSHLILAAKTLAEAHFVLALIYSIEGANQLASAEMERYRRATQRK